ncbi:MAG TPA: hypothetical protein VFQ22_04565 [Longimicrobiales bacterium]|nr:hypothetical protein [Longimicrobiales bacterium]
MQAMPDGWMALLLLGAFHGVNPGMGWLFAVALGLQERSGRAVWRALPPLLAGHALAVAFALALAAALGLAIGAAAVRLVLAATLVTMGVMRLRRAWHPRFGGMRVGARDLVVWSFLMATGHGAGLMALAFVDSGLGDGFLAALVHTAGYALLTGLLAALIYYKLGLRLLQRGWLNLDLVWAASLVLTGLLLLA